MSLQVYARVVRPAFRNRQKQIGDLNAMLNDNLSGIREIKAFTREDQQARLVHQSVDNYRKSLLNALKLKLSLQIAGFDARFHAYDWRRSVGRLAEELG